jgi:lysophospholipase L1-like esterase
MKILRVLVLGMALAGLPSASIGQSLFESGARVLFQGDSITDMGRGRSSDPNHILGHGYAFIIAAKEGADFPERRLVFINRGVSGNTVGELASRWNADALAFKPDVLSVLIGVNDAGRKLGGNEPFVADEFAKIYDQLLAETVAALPNVKLVLGEPFYAPGRATAARMDDWKSAMKALRAATEKLAGKYRAPVVHYQKVFDDAFKRAPVDYWIWDGIHPTYAGHQLMADEWRRAYRAFYGPPGGGR